MVAQLCRQFASNQIPNTAQGQEKSHRLVKEGRVTAPAPLGACGAAAIPLSACF